MAQNWPASCMPRVLGPVTNPHYPLGQQFYALPARLLTFVQDSAAARVHAKVVRKREEPPGMIVRVYKQIITWGLKWSLAQIT